MPGPLDGIFGAMFGSISERVAPVIDNSLRPWATNLARDAMKSWSPVLLAGLRCGVPVSPTTQIRCGAPAVSACICCGQPSCLHHALVAQTAAVVCIKCVTAYMALLRDQGGDHAAPHAPWVESPFERGQPRQPPPPPHAPAAPVDAAALREKHLRTLGLDEDADDDDIRAAFKDMAKTWHPDRASEDQKARFTKKFLKIKAAYEYLCNNKVDA